MAIYKERSRHIFIDESGDPNINTNKEGVSDYFVVSAIIVDSSLLEQENEKLQLIINKYFQRGELKSSRIGCNSTRRVQILNDISKIKFKHYSQVIDKSKISKESGLGFSKSFIKYINRTIYKQLFEAFSNLHIITDEHGRSDFMNGFLDYLRKKLPLNLFETSTFSFGNSKIFPFIQVADIIAGSISRSYSGKDPISVLNAIKNNTIIIDEWPPCLPEPLGLEELSEIEQYNYLIRTYAFNKASDFIDRNATINVFNIKAQVAAVRYLLYYFRSINPEEYVTTNKIATHLAELGFPMNERMLRSKIIGKLREEGVIIASSRRGIKIPYSIYDLRSFVQRVNSQVVPYIKRLERSRKQFLLATEGKLDIVSEKEFPQLYKYIIST